MWIRLTALEMCKNITNFRNVDLPTHAIFQFYEKAKIFTAMTLKGFMKRAVMF